jgi:hypothetical protein
MTSKAKAAWLVLKYMSKLNDVEQSKECALVAVDELLNHCYEVMKPFWEEVKIEIEKL